MRREDLELVKTTPIQRQNKPMSVFNFPLKNVMLGRLPRIRLRMPPERQPTTVPKKKRLAGNGRFLAVLASK